jgi:hypothetical protein
VYKLSFHVPASHLEETKRAVFAAGAGSVGSYEHCCWQVLGEGQFRPRPGSAPHLGQAGQLEQVAEYRVEMVCDDGCASAVVAALKQAHPYEMPSYAIWELAEF